MNRVSVAGAIGLLSTIAATGATPRPASPSLRVQRIGEMTTERAAHQATLLTNGQVLITGGCPGQNCHPFLRSVEIFDPTRRTFRLAALMTIPRASHTATLLQDGRVLVAGGCSTNGATASAEVYDVATDRWSKVGDMTLPRCSHIAVPLVDGRVFIMGGGEGRLGNLTSAEVFDPRTSTFVPVGSMRSNHYLATRLADGRVLLTGGQGSRGEMIRSADIFDPASGKFQPTGDMVMARVKHAAALLSDGRVLIIGGTAVGGSERFSSTEIYDPRTGRFSPGPSMRSGRYKIRDAVATLGSGAVLVAGGATTLELYDPVRQVFVPTRGDMSGPQLFATATLLRNSEVLVLGGYDQRIRSSASAWIVSGMR